MTQQYKKMEADLQARIGKLEKDVVNQETEIKNQKEDLANLHHDKEEMIE